MNQNDLVYFRDNFFSAGETDILNEQEEKIGWLDLKSMFTASLDVYDQSGRCLHSGRFQFFGGWVITDGEGSERFDQRLSISELIAVVMGVSAIEKRRQNSTAT
ncbi:hypothetical protein [Brevibacillus massiliensis]|uniref:hypothetical protein n=1 Tax=Brevibacillus massiliensis TaxID=1118054 RepID=UPI00030F3AA5|nr:hypothetical protein [Brevibacillus massiliensis]